MNAQAALGATYLGDHRCQFNVWAPFVDTMEAHIMTPNDRTVALERDAQGYHRALVHGVEPGTTYYYVLDGAQERPDPASRLQTQGVHGPSSVVSSAFGWQDHSWFGLPLHRYIIYELHVGTFTHEGTFDALLSHLDYLKDLGVTAVEIMPVAQFPGKRNWGYDGVYPFAVQDSYGGPDGLKRFVNACHLKGLAVILDVVYNHLGPEGNYMRDFAPYFTDWYRTPWGAAINFDGPDSDHVKRFFIENALYWMTEFHIDALRLDAVHAILDHSSVHFLEELSEAIEARADAINRRAFLIAESSDNDRRLLMPRRMGGLGMDAQWSDDFHHCVHTLLTGERGGYYQDYGSVKQLADAIQAGFVYSGAYSQYRRRRHGTPSGDLPGQQFVICTQNHDQIGNRLLGERLSALASFESLKLAAGLLLSAPNIPLLFMGEEYGETAPFQYFISHTDLDLVEAVREGRRREFASFAWQEAPPDPQDEATFQACILDLDLRDRGPHQDLLALYRELLRLRRERPALSQLRKDRLETRYYETAKALYLRRWSDIDEVALLFHFDDSPSTLTVPLPVGNWSILLDSADRRWHGHGSTMPTTVVSEGEVMLVVAPTAFLVLGKDAG
jgi:maltooligosyltrehalose trehalohydrolase